MDEHFGEVGERVNRIVTRLQFLIGVLTAVLVVVGGMAAIDAFNAPD